MFSFRKKSSETQYKAEKEELVLLRSKYQDRTFAEELDYLESLGGDTFASTLSVDYSKGILKSEIASRRAQYGSAVKDEPKNFLSYMAGKIARQLEDTTLKAILILSIMSILINIAVKGSDISNWIEEFATLMAILTFIIIGGSGQDQREQKFRSHKIYLDRGDYLVEVWRNGWSYYIYKSELVTGDIVKITPEMKIPADMLLIEDGESSNVTTDESNYTGEICSVTKRLLHDCIKQRDEIIANGKKDSTGANNVYSPILLLGTKVLSGEGKAIVLLVDESSRSERVKGISEDGGDVSRLQMKLENVARDLGKFGLGTAAIIFLVLVIKFFIERVRTDTLSEGAQYVQFIDFLMTIVTIIIVAIPEGLPLAAASAMAYSVNTMRSNEILVKKLQDLEYLGAVNSLCCSINGSIEDYKTLKDAGIRLRIVTEGDKMDVETFIEELESIELSSKENVCMNGNDFLELVGGIVCKKCKTKNCNCPTNDKTAKKSRREMRLDEIGNFDAFAGVCDQLHVLARSHSEAKTALIVGLKQKGDIVAVSGDGSDDVLIFRKADVGLALESSIEVVKEAAGIVLLDNRLNTLAEAVMWSRNIYDNTRKYLQYQLTAIIVVVSINLVSAFTCSKPLLSSAQLIWISIFLESQGSFVLVHEEPSREVLNRKPYNINGDIVSGTMFKQILGQAFFQFVLLMGIAYSVPDSENLHAQQSSAVHMTFLMCQILNLLNCRKIHGEINVFSGISRWFLLFEILLFIVFVSTHYLMMDLFHSLVWTFFASLTLIWPVIMKLCMKTRQASKTHEKTE